MKLIIIITININIKPLVILLKIQTNLKKIIQDEVNKRPETIPIIAPDEFTLFEKIPIIKAGKIDEAAKPKANATT